MGNTIEIVRGRDKELRLYVHDSSGSTKTLGTGEKFIFGVKKNFKDNVISNLTKEIVVDDLDSRGFYKFNIASNDTKDLKPGDYFYDIGYLTSNGEYKTVIPASKFVILPNVTDKDTEEASNNA